MGITNQSFDPRVATAQLIFGVIYVMITLIALCLAFYVQSEKEPYLYYFMAVLFGLMAAKSFFIFSRTRTLLKEGVYHEAKVDDITAVRGITTIKGTCEIKDFGLIYIESRLVGESIAHELTKFMKDRKQNSLPALVVGINGNRPRGMFSIKSKYGHLDEESAMLKNPADIANNVNEQEQKDATSNDNTQAHGSLDADGNINLQSPEEIVANAVAQADAEIKAAKENEEKEAADATESSESSESSNVDSSFSTDAKTDSILPEAGVDKKTDEAIMDALNKAENESKPKI